MKVLWASLLISIILFLQPNSSAPPQLIKFNPEEVPHDVATCDLDSTLALSFDDGPSVHTRELLATLKELNVKATFFVLGAQVKKYPDVLKEAYMDGHHIGLHTYSHIELTKATESTIINEVNSVAELINSIIGVYPTFFRPPYGIITNREYHILERMGLTVTLWDLDTKDWDDETDPFVGFDTFLYREHNSLSKYRGYISLQHDTLTHSVSHDQIKKIHALSRRRGFTFSTISNCSNIPMYRSGIEKSPAEVFMMRNRLDAMDVVAMTRSSKEGMETQSFQKKRVQQEVYLKSIQEMNEMKGIYENTEINNGGIVNVQMVLIFVAIAVLVALYSRRNRRP